MVNNFSHKIKKKTYLALMYGVAFIGLNHPCYAMSKDDAFFDHRKTSHLAKKGASGSLDRSKNLRLLEAEFGCLARSSYKSETMRRLCLVSALADAASDLAASPSMPPSAKEKVLELSRSTRSLVHSFEEQGSLIIPNSGSVSSTGSYSSDSEPRGLTESQQGRQLELIDALFDDFLNGNFTIHAQEMERRYKARKKQIGKKRKKFDTYGSDLEPLLEILLSEVVHASKEDAGKVVTREPISEYLWDAWEEAVEELRSEMSRVECTETEYSDDEDSDADDLSSTGGSVRGSGSLKVSGDGKDRKSFFSDTMRVSSQFLREKAQEFDLLILKKAAQDIDLAKLDETIVSLSSNSSDGSVSDEETIEREPTAEKDRLEEEVLTEEELRKQNEEVAKRLAEEARLKKEAKEKKREEELRREVEKKEQAVQVFEEKFTNLERAFKTPYQSLAELVKVVLDENTDFDGLGSRASALEKTLSGLKGEIENFYKEAEDSTYKEPLKDVRGKAATAIKTLQDKEEERKQFAEKLQEEKERREEIVRLKREAEERLVRDQKEAQKQFGERYTKLEGIFNEPYQELAQLRAAFGKTNPDLADLHTKVSKLAETFTGYKDQIETLQQDLERSAHVAVLSENGEKAKEALEENGRQEEARVQLLKEIEQAQQKKRLEEEARREKARVRQEAEAKKKAEIEAKSLAEEERKRKEVARQESKSKRVNRKRSHNETVLENVNPRHHKQPKLAQKPIEEAVHQGEEQKPLKRERPYVESELENLNPKRQKIEEVKTKLPVAKVVDEQVQTKNGHLLFKNILGGKFASKKAQKKYEKTIRKQEKKSRRKALKQAKALKKLKRHWHNKYQKSLKKKAKNRKIYSKSTRKLMGLSSFREALRILFRGLMFNRYLPRFGA